MADEKNVSKAPAGRAKRVPVGTRGVIPRFQMEDGYQYRIVNDTDDRIERFEEAGWEMIDSAALKKSERRVNSPAPEGSKARISVGQGTQGYIMRQRDEYYVADQAEKQDRVTASEETMRQQALNKSDYGKLELSRS